MQTSRSHPLAGALAAFALFCDLAIAAEPLDYPVKPAFYQSWAQHGPYYNHSSLLRTLTSISNLNLTAYHNPFVLILDGGWAAPTRDANGRLQFDPEKFPSGSNVVKLIHDYGCKAAVWLESNGPGITPSSGTPSTSGTNIQFDAETVAGWGFDGAKFDLISYESGAAKVEMVTRFINAFRAVATNRTTYFYHDVGPNIGRDQFPDFPAGAVICENSENDPTDILFWTRTMTTHLWNANGRNHWSCGREVYEAWWYGPSFMKVWSMLGSPYVFTALKTAEHYPYKEIYTRRECIALNNDPLYAAPTLLFQTATNLGLARRRSDGTTTALAFNMTTNQTQSFTLSFADLGFPAGQAVNLREIYLEADLGRFTNSHSFTLGPMESTLLTLESIGQPPRLDVVRDLAPEIRLMVQARTNHTVILQKSPDFANWVSFATNREGARPWVFQETTRVGEERQFFRVVRP